MNFLKKALPWIGAAATGNVPALINMGAAEISKALGKKIDPSLDAMSAAVAGATPEQILALKQADNDFAVKMQALGFSHETELEQLAVNDRNSARQREMTVRDRIPAILAIGVTVGFFGILLYMLKAGLPNDGREPLLLMLGSLGAGWTSVMAYYFGSSAGSAKKDDTIRAATQK
jgi:hypothetical protein